MNSSRKSHDLRSFAAQLEEQGELVRISREVEPRFELPALLQQLEQNRKAFIFENIKGARFPLIGGLLNSTERLGQAIGKDTSGLYDHRHHAEAFLAAEYSCEVTVLPEEEGGHPKAKSALPDKPSLVLE